jgi:hypothetical protein
MTQIFRAVGILPDPPFSLCVETKAQNRGVSPTPPVRRRPRLLSRLCLLLRPFVAPLSLSTLAGFRVASCHATASRLPAPLPLIAPPPLIAPLSCLLSGWLSRCLSSHRRLPSACASASHRTATYYRAPLTPLVRLVVASPLVIPPPPVNLRLRLSSRLLSGWLLHYLLSRRHLRLSSHRRISLHPSCASYLAGCCISSRQAATSRPPAPLPLSTPTLHTMPLSR